MNNKFPDIYIEQMLQELVKEMRYLKAKNTDEYRITRKKIGNFRLVLYKLYQKGFEQGVYTANDTRIS